MLDEVALARSRRLVDDQVKTVRVNGALECSNSFCPAFRVGYTLRPRDAQAAVNIGIAGLSALGLDTTEDSSNNPTKDKSPVDLVDDTDEKANIRKPFKIKEPIAPFRSYLRPHERQRNSAGSSTRIQHLQNDAMGTP
ncbi:hypothetical protein BGZ65_004884 [Modicella reniformis]|uniref:Uncharacterized protein n=1 Tax=Modicella reniformis TaxID=1440133 RepID=A0A9P6MB92_9FUNG|nr:hypothetical protein BGZ65_004884 [Modicella reniformis]